MKTEFDTFAGQDLIDLEDISHVVAQESANGVITSYIITFKDGRSLTVPATLRNTAILSGYIKPAPITNPSP
jgi:hypothetical protein